MICLRSPERSLVFLVVAFRLERPAARLSRDFRYGPIGAALTAPTEPAVPSASSVYPSQHVKDSHSVGLSACAILPGVAESARGALGGSCTSDVDDARTSAPVPRPASPPVGPARRAHLPRGGQGPPDLRP